MIKVACTQCQKAFQVAEQHAGKQARCPGCKAPITIPAVVVEAALVDDDDLAGAINLARQTPTLTATNVKVTPAGKPPVTEQQILAAFHGRIEPVQTTITYKLGILLVSAVMLLLPLIYVSLIALVGYGVYWHLANDHAMLNVRGNGKAQAA